MDKSDLLEEIVYTLEDLNTKAYRLEKYPEDCSDDQLLEVLTQIEDGIKYIFKNIKRLSRRIQNED